MSFRVPKQPIFLFIYLFIYLFSFLVQNMKFYSLTKWSYHSFQRNKKFAAALKQPFLFFETEIPNSIVVPKQAFVFLQ